MNMIKRSFLMLVCSLNLVLTHVLWYDGFEGMAGLTVINSVNGQNCVIGNCFGIENQYGIGSITTISKNTLGYHNIQLKYSIKPQGLVTANDICNVYYIISSSWTSLKSYHSDDNWLINETVNLGNDANNVSDLRIRFDITGQAGSPGYCLFDEVYLLGTSVTMTPTTTVTTTSITTDTTNAASTTHTTNRSSTPTPDYTIIIIIQFDYILSDITQNVNNSINSLKNLTSAIIDRGMKNTSIDDCYFHDYNIMITTDHVNGTMNTNINAEISLCNENDQRQLVAYFNNSLKKEFVQKLHNEIRLMVNSVFVHIVGETIVDNIINTTTIFNISDDVKNEKETKADDDITMIFIGMASIIFCCVVSLMFYCCWKMKKENNVQKRGSYDIDKNTIKMNTLNTKSSSNKYNATKRNDTVKNDVVYNIGEQNIEIKSFSENEGSIDVNINDDIIIVDNTTNGNRLENIGDDEFVVNGDSTKC